MKRYILAVDQSTQGTKGLLFDEAGRMCARTDRPHAQLVNDRGWVEHDPEEILENTLRDCRDAVEKAGVSPEEIAAFAISNQRETSICSFENIRKKISLHVGTSLEWLFVIMIILQ